MLSTRNYKKCNTNRIFRSHRHLQQCFIGVCSIKIIIAVRAAKSKFFVTQWCAGGPKNLPCKSDRHPLAGAKLNQFCVVPPMVLTFFVDGQRGQVA